jgi:hypothetical protein
MKMQKKEMSKMRSILITVLVLATVSLSAQGQNSTIENLFSQLHTNQDLVSIIINDNMLKTIAKDANADSTNILNIAGELNKVWIIKEEKSPAQQAILHTTLTEWLKNSNYTEYGTTGSGQIKSSIYSNGSTDESAEYLLIVREQKICSAYLLKGNLNEKRLVDLKLFAQRE